MIELRVRTEENARIFFEKAQDDQIRRYLPMKARSVDEAAADFLETQRPDANSYGVCIYYNNAYIGDIWCYAIHADEQIDAMLSYCVFEKKLWGRGIAGTAVRLFIAEITKRFSLHNIGAFTYADNIGSVKVLERNEFRMAEKIEEDGILSYFYVYNAD